jgi:hypothetical protein
MKLKARSVWDVRATPHFYGFLSAETIIFFAQIPVNIWRCVISEETSYLVSMAQQVCLDSLFGWSTAHWIVPFQVMPPSLWTKLSYSPIVLIFFKRSSSWMSLQ